ncbi:hypothetical protein Btru_030360 [Bulinus truncatus]|nr:hypothetical protein Btru_030360 [Bulinus truncatus]
MLEDSELNMSEVSPAIAAMWRLIHTLNSEKLAWQRQLQLKNKDPADTSGVVGVLDKSGNLRIVYASGFQTLTEYIQDVGNVRLRYPIPPIHGEGSTVWKELSVVKQQLSQLQKSGPAPVVQMYQAQLQPTSVGGLHYHEFTLYQQDYDLIKGSQVISISTSLSNGHSHNLDIWLNNTSSNIEYLTCDGQPVCRDLHPNIIKFASSSGR